MARVVEGCDHDYTIFTRDEVDNIVAASYNTKLALEELDIKLDTIQEEYDGIHNHESTAREQHEREVIVKGLASLELPVRQDLVVGFPEEMGLTGSSMYVTPIERVDGKFDYYILVMYDTGGYIGDDYFQADDIFKVSDEVFDIIKTRDFAPNHDYEIDRTEAVAWFIANCIGGVDALMWYHNAAYDSENDVHDSFYDEDFDEENEIAPVCLNTKEFRPV